MKKLLLTLFLFSPIFVFAQPPNPSNYVWTKHLKVGQNGGQVDSIKVVGDEDRLVRVGSFAVGDRLGQEDYAVAAVEVLGLQLLHHVHIDRPVIERQVLTFEDPDLRPFRWTGVVVARAFGGSEVKLEIARFSRGQASGPEPDDSGKHSDDQGA